MSDAKIKVLCVDDEVELLNVYRVFLEPLGYECIAEANPLDAIGRYRENNQDLALVISDFRMAPIDGFAFRREVMGINNSVPFVIISGHVTKEMALKALDLRIAGFHDKPLTPEQFRAIVEKHATARAESIRETRMLCGIFVDEAQSILDELDSLMLQLDTSRDDADLLNIIYRNAHTLKGSSGVLDNITVTRYLHKYEDILSDVRKGSLALSDSVYEVLLKGLDRIKELVAAVSARKLHEHRLEDLLPELEISATPSAGAPATAEAAHANSPQARPQTRRLDAPQSSKKDSVAVPTRMLDELAAHAGEITVIRNMVNKIVRSLERQMSGHRDVQSLGELFEEMHKINSSIQTRITELRKVPLSNVVKTLPRLTRDLGRDLGKSLKLEILGEDTRIDNSLASVLSNSLVHLLRNAADHGLESPDDRRAQGKPEQGTIKLSCREHRDDVLVTLTDDGRGIDPERIRSKAREKKLVSEERLATMSTQETLGLIFASGFSTAAQVTDVSGRGVGMDMVRSSVESVGGRIDIDSKIGHGTTFTLTLPVPKSVLIINSLLVGADGREYAIPQDALVRLFRFEGDARAQSIQESASGRVLRVENCVYPLLSLRSLIRAPATLAVDCERCEVLLLRSEGLVYALEVDEIRDSEEIVVKPLPACFNPRQLYAGATFLGDGTVGLILDVKSLAEIGGLSADSASRPAQSTNVTSVAQPQPPKDELILFTLDCPGVFGTPLARVFRLEDISTRDVKIAGERPVVIYREQVMPILTLRKALNLPAAATPPSHAVDTSEVESFKTLVTKSPKGFVGLRVKDILDIATPTSDIMQDFAPRPGIQGSTIIRHSPVAVVDLDTVVENTLQKMASTTQDPVQVPGSSSPEPHSS